MVFLKSAALQIWLLALRIKQLQPLLFPQIPFCFISSELGELNRDFFFWQNAKVISQQDI